MSAVKMVVTYPTYLVLRELIWNIRLGDSNVFESDISDLAKMMDEEHNAATEAENTYGIPKLHFEFSNDEGFTINILEE